MKNICVIGTGYVGLVTGTCFADLGNCVVALDIDAKKIELLKQGFMPIYEPGLKEMVERNYAARRLQFTTDYEEALKDAEFVFICVGTPEGVDGEADLQYVRAAAETVARTMDHPLIIINKSTVPVGTGDWVADIVRSTQPKPIDFAVVSCPEFLREGSAMTDFIHPDRTVLGSTDKAAAEKVAQLYLPLRAPIVMTDLRTAEMIKYASNAFLATRISFINEISIICEQLGADVTEVADGMGFDKRIGHHFLQAGVGYGGSCFTGDETIFTLNSPNVAAEKLADVFEQSGTTFQGDVVEVAIPQDKRVLAFDLETGRSTLAAVTAVTRRPYSGVMVNIKTSMGRSLKVTADHPVILRTDNGFDIVPAASVTAGDKLMALCELPQVEPSPAMVELWQTSKATATVFDTDNGQVMEFAPLGKQQANTMALMLQSAGIVPSLHPAERGTHTLRVSGEQVARLDNLDNFAPIAAIQDGFTREGDYAVLTVQAVEHEETETVVYSLETTTGTVIAASGLISHNCFPKDVKALAYMAQTHGMHPQLLNAVMDINNFQRKHIMLKVHDVLGDLKGKQVGLLGLAFKENTDDIRESPSLTIAEQLLEQGAIVRAYDPVAMENSQRVLPDVQMCSSPYDVAAGAEALIVATPWNEFKQLDMDRIRQSMARPVLIDGRNMYEPALMREYGFEYRGVGRGYNGNGMDVQMP